MVTKKEKQRPKNHILTGLEEINENIKLSIVRVF